MKNPWKTPYHASFLMLLTIMLFMMALQKANAQDLGWAKLGTNGADSYYLNLDSRHYTLYKEHLMAYAVIAAKKGTQTTAAVFVADCDENAFTVVDAHNKQLVSPRTVKHTGSIADVAFGLLCGKVI